MQITDDLSFQELNAIFSMLSQTPNLVVWISSPDFNKQIFLNDSFEKIFKLERNVLFQDATKFYDLLVPDDRLETYKKNMYRVEGNFEQGQDIYYRTQVGNQIIPVKDTYFPLTKNNETKSFI